METPDSKGFVNIIWPSKSVPHGGIFDSQVVEHSPAQQEFLKVLQEESKLSIAQRRKSAWKLREEPKQTTSRVAPQGAKLPLEPVVRPHTSRRRSLSAIRESGALDVDHYRPLKRGEDRDKLKEQLANYMTYGDIEQTAQTPPKTLAKKSGPKLPTKKEQWNDLVTQIRERAEWLADMEALGHAGPHRDLIKDQIAERLRALDALGVDSHCSSARSIASGFSVLDSGKRSYHSDKSVKSTHSVASQALSKDKKPSKKRGATKEQKQEENVTQYEKLSPLQYSPRRRV